LPDTPAAHQLSALLDVFNRGDRTALTGFVERNVLPDVIDVDDEMHVRKMSGGYDLRKVEESDPTRLVGLVQERDSDFFFRVTLEVEAVHPHRISRVDGKPAPRPPEWAIPRMTETALVAALRDEIARDVAADRFAGAVLWQQGGRVVFQGAYGMADRDTRVPNTLHTRFRLGSMNKMFTAVAALQLVHAGNMRLGDTLNVYLPDYPNRDIASKVTIHQLLTHTGGTGDFFGPDFDSHRTELRALSDYVALFGKRGPEFEPGSRHEYSNYGFLLLGLAIEKASGESYYDYVREHVYEPAGMSSTGSLPEDVAVPDRSVGYTTFQSDTWRPNADTLPYRGTPAGGGYSSVEDLRRFADALLHHTLLDEAMTELLTRGKVDTPYPGARYAYGFGDVTEGGVRYFGHSGGAPGMNGDLRIYPDSGQVVIVLSNLDPPSAQRLAAFVGNRIPVE
jgi:CubicO group peptidase (beta-lactamase class C family)